MQSQPLKMKVGPVRESPLNIEQLRAGLSEVEASPHDNGTVEALVIRPGENLRTIVNSVTVCSEQGVHGDSWSKGCWKKLPDGSPHPDVQVAIMNSRMIDLAAGSQELWSAAGDNLFVDMDLSKENLPSGQKLTIGQTLLEITSEPHLGCKKFALRFGIDAVRFVNSPRGRELRLRGVYARVLRAGEIKVGDRMNKVKS